MSTERSVSRGRRSNLRRCYVRCQLSFSLLRNPHFLLNAGGDIYASGRKDPDTDWLVGIKHPRDAEMLTAQFSLRDFAVATSGDYERYSVIDGHRYHHILDPKTGYPGTQSRGVTVLAPSVEEADVWATYLFLLGPAALQQTSTQEMPYLIVDTDGQVHVTASFKHKTNVRLLN